MKITYLSFIVLVLLISGGGCNELTSPEVISRAELPFKGTTSLPTINGISPDFSFLTFKKSYKDSETLMSVIDKEQLVNFAKELGKTLSHDFVAVFGSIDTTGKVFNYSYAKLNFEEDLLFDYSGDNELFFYTVGDEENGIQKIAFAWIPNAVEAKETFFNWILPRYKGAILYPSFDEPKGKNPTYDLACDWVKTTPGGYVYYGEGSDNAKYFSPTYEYQCTSSEPLGGSSGYSADGGGAGWYVPTYNWDFDPIHGDKIYVIDMRRLPCLGNPIKFPRIASQRNSGIQGGREGNTRSNGTQYHSGLDLLNGYNAPIFAPKNGTIVSTGYDPEGLGYYVTLQFLHTDGSYYTLQFGHLQQPDAMFNGKTVNAGDVIGVQGDSGNLAEAIDKKFCDSHTHIIARKRTTASWNISTYTIVNPETVITTQFNANGAPISSTDC